MIKRIYLAVVLVVFTGLSAMAQGGNGAIKIILQDKATKEAIPFANVVAYKDGVQVGVATTNMDGEAIIKPLSPGLYTVKGVYVGYQTQEVKGILVGDGKTAYQTIGLSNGEGVKLDEVEVIVYQVPLIDPDTKSGQTVTREDYQNLATKDINSVAATTAGVFQADEGKAINVRGGRSGNTTYFVDGVKVFGTPNLPQQSIEQLNVITGGVPAMYGDLTSGAISISTRGPQSKYFGGVEMISSQLTDPYGYNSLGFSVGGPLLKKKDSTHRTVLGFFVSGQGNYVKDNSPSFVPINVVNDEKLQEIKDAPLLPSPSGTGFVRASEFITKDDINQQKFRPNASSRLLALNGKIDYAPTGNTNISLGGFYEFADNYNSTVANNLLNSVNNSKTSNRTFRTNLSITQKFGNTGNKEKTQSILSNSFFRFLVSYENLQRKTFSPNHKDDYFNYGYVGKFERQFLEKDFAYNYNFTESFDLNGQEIHAYAYRGKLELPVIFTPSELNPDAAIYTSYLLANSRPVTFGSNYIQGNGGVVNGGRPANVYSLFNNFGFYNATNRNQIDEQFRIATSFNTDIKNHALTFGLEFDQRTTSFFALNAHGLWDAMRATANKHTTELELSNPILVPQFSGLVPYYFYENKYQADKQTQFSEKILEKLGLPKDYTGFINTDALDPSQLSLDMFSADDLFYNQSNRAVGYNGFTHDGKKVGGKVNISDFLDQKDGAGRNLYPIGTFKPIYASVFVMDKFDFKDIKFNVGLRVDRYDANQQVLKDKYAFHELAKVSDLSSLENLPAGFTDNIPSNISKDAAIYVAQAPTGGKSPLFIKGYRHEDKWYDSEGNELSDPSLLVASSGNPVPLFKDRSNYDKKMSIGGFTQYAAAINVMPRIAFSFPISDVANFFAHYDILTQRPTNNILNPLDYYFMDAESSSPLINNPNQKPQQTIDYELGFSQILNERKNASLTITSFYREMRNMINQRVITGAYPKTYLMYDNIDFATTKGLSFVFDFRRTGGSRYSANYTLQFAEGTGSGVNSGANLAQSGQPNLRILQPLDFDQRHSFVLNYDYRFGAEKDYKGPSIKTKSGKTIQLFEDVGFNLSFILGSGTPYTRWNTAVPFGGNARSSIVGQINGSSKPWSYRGNLRIDKNIELSWGKNGEENKKTADLNIYLQVLNVLNTRNILNVYNFTGNPTDDGYLTSTQAQAALALANSATSYTDMYNISINAPGNYSSPRQIRIGLMFNF
ncbi:MAG: TonB-dependent receptor plug domain-containing protein [Bacteroidota bacterium]|nr:TonB-dependent receptor plug domain-containing protein [Bacteroidota bacterium]MDP3146557.1 TonB-dependent receptor plug domain-containing protein [Bacteroidota bacterium]